MDGDVARILNTFKSKKCLFRLVKVLFRHNVILKIGLMEVLMRSVGTNVIHQVSKKMAALETIIATRNHHYNSMYCSEVKNLVSIKILK